MEGHASSPSTLSKRFYLTHLDPALDHILPQGDGNFRLYSIPQTLYKIHPDYDFIIKRILLADPGGFIVVPAGLLHEAWTARLQRRLQASLGLDLMAKILYIRSMGSREYITLLSVVDVVLDTFPVGGGRSSYEIFSVGAPIVVLYPRTSILQLTAGMYAAMDIMQSAGCVTSSVDQFVATAVEVPTLSKCL